MVLPVVFALKTTIVLAVIQVSVLIKNGVKTENAQFRTTLIIVLNVQKIAIRDYL